MIKKDFFYKITSSWTFLFIAIYGTVALFFSIFTAFINIFTGFYNASFFEIFSQIFNIILIASTGLHGAISVISLFFLILLQVTNEVVFSIISPAVLVIIGICCTNYLNASQGGIDYFVIYLLCGIPITFICFILPLFLLFFLEIFNKIPPPQNHFPSKAGAIIAFSYIIFILIYLLIY